MAVSVPEVMYGAYYPYLYGRGAARSFHHAPHFQYDRFNVGSGAGAGAGAGSGAGAGGGGGEAFGGGAALSTGSGSSGAHSPASPPHAHAHALPPHPHPHPHAAHPSAHLAPRLRAKEEDLSAHSHGRASASADGNGSSDSEGECGGGGGGGGGGGAGRARAQYVSANCVVFTHYSGDVAAVVDEHFTRALSVDKPKESVPMVSRNLPASFFNAAAAAGVPCGVELYEYDPWGSHYAHAHHAHHAAHAHAAHAHAAAQGYAPRHEYHNMAAAGYQQLLLGRGALPQYKPVEWAHAQGHAHAHAHAHLDPASYSYPAVPGLEAQVQDSSKDLYWF